MEDVNGKTDIRKPISIVYYILSSETFSGECFIWDQLALRMQPVLKFVFNILELVLIIIKLNPKNLKNCHNIQL